MDWTQTITILATVIGSAYYIHRDLNKAMKMQSENNDKLYWMFIDLLRQIKETK